MSFESVARDTKTKVPHRKYTGNDTFRALAENSVRQIASLVRLVSHPKIVVVTMCDAACPHPRNSCSRNRPLHWAVGWRFCRKFRACAPREAISDRTQTWGGGSDSYLEYLIKYARITNTNDNLFADTWATAVDSSIHTLLRVRSPHELHVLSLHDGARYRHPPWATTLTLPTLTTAPLSAMLVPTWHASWPVTGSWVGSCSTTTPS